MSGGGWAAAAGGAFKAIAGKGLRKGAKRARLLEEQSIARALGYYQPYADVAEKWRQGASDEIGQAVAPEWTGYDEALPEFSAPTADSMTMDPSYQFRLSQGQQALENSAAARGGLLSGNTGRALQDYGQGAASQEYGNIWDRAMQDYNTRMQRWGVGRGAAERDYGFGNQAWQQNLNNAWNKINYGSNIAAQRAGIERGTQAPEWMYKGYQGQAQMRSDVGDSLMGMGSAQMGAGGGSGGST